MMVLFLANGVSKRGDNYEGLHAIDHVVVGVYFAVMLGLGYFFSRRQKDTDEYFLAGRNMHWFAVGLSIIATLLSTISYLATPGEMIKNGVGALGGIFAHPLIFLVGALVLLPFLMSLRVTSVYEYLENRFDLNTRLFGASLFVLIRLAWMGMIVFTASRALAKMSGVPVWAVVLGVGVIAIVYTTLGGLRAVIWTDVAQFTILFGGGVFTILYVAIATGTGPLSWWQDATGVERVAQPIFSLDPFERVTIVGMAIQAFFWWVCTAGSDQVALQRFFSTPSRKAAQRSFACNLVADASLTVLLGLTGIALYSYYKAHLPDTADQVFPHFIAHALPRGVAGLVVAALFSAAMSSLDSGMNSVSTVVTADFYRRLRKAAPKTEQELVLARIATVATGLVAITICGLLFLIPEAKRGNLLDLTNQVSSFIVGGLGGLFFIAIFLRRCIGPVAIAGTVIGMLVGFYMAQAHWFQDPPAYYLSVQKGPDLVGQRWLLSHETVNAIGSDPTVNSFVLPGEGVARRHAEIHWTGKGWRLVNVDQWEKTVVGSRPVTSPVELKAAQVIAVGPYKLAVHRKMISWMWIIPASCVITFVTAAVVTLLLNTFLPETRGPKFDRKGC